MMNGRGQEAVEYVSKSTVDYYNDMLQKIKTYDSNQVEQLSLLDKMTLLSTRAQTPKDSILQMKTGADLFLYAIDNGMIGKESMSNVAIGEVTITKNFAKAEYLFKGQKTPFFMHFLYEDDAWHFNLTHNLQLVRPAFKKIIDENELTETEFVLFMLESLTGEIPSSDIWQPLQ